MIVPGQILDNPVTGERLVFHETSTSTNGEAVGSSAAELFALISDL